MAFEWTDEAKTEAQELLTRYPVKRGALIPLLYLVQGAQGWVSPEGMVAVAELTDTSPATVMGVATFYPMFYLEPVGKYVLEVCSTLPCRLCGSQEIEDQITSKLGIGPGETTTNGKFTLRKVECLASCGTAPAIMVNRDLHESLTSKSLDQLLDGLE